MVSYDESLALFSPDGRLLQVEYAQQASEQGNLIVVSSNNKKIAIIYEKETNTFQKEIIPKVKEVNRKLKYYITFTGLTPDSYIVLNKARVICAEYKISTTEDISLKQLAQSLGSFLQKHTTTKSLRPFGLSLILFGFDKKETKIFIMTADGNFSEYKKGALGQKANKAITKLEEETDLDIRKEVYNVFFSVMRTDKKNVRMVEISQSGITTVDLQAIK